MEVYSFQLGKKNCTAEYINTAPLGILKTFIRKSLWIPDNSLHLWIILFKSAHGALKKELYRSQEQHSYTNCAIHTPLLYYELLLTVNTRLSAISLSILQGNYHIWKKLTLLNHSSEYWSSCTIPLLFCCGWNTDFCTFGQCAFGSGPCSYLYQHKWGKCQKKECKKQEQLSVCTHRTITTITSFFYVSCY